MSLSVVSIIAVALAFDFFNGFHDAANSIATVVSTRVLTPRQAVAWAAFFNFAAFLIFGTKVADTISNVVHPGTLTNAGIFAALVGAILWDIVTWILGLPTSSSHALVGGLAGAAVATAGWRTLVASEYQKIFVFIVLSPIVGILLAFTFMTGVFWLFHRYRKVEKLIRGVTLAGIPVSTTHTIAGAIVGVGTTQRLSAVRWGVAGRVVWAWVLTIPGAFIMAWIAYLPFKGLVR